MTSCIQRRYDFPMMHKERLPERLQPWLNGLLKKQGVDLSQSQEIAQNVLEISQHFQDASSQTPWTTTAGIIAYLAYYLPLNLIRAQKVIRECQRQALFHENSQVLDFGCGPGTFSQALESLLPFSVKSLHGVDTHGPLKEIYLGALTSEAKKSFTSSIGVPPHQDILVASYVINELKQVPSWFFDFKNLVIMEPSTQQAFPALAALREQLIESGFHILAPCPHQQACPLQSQKSDWCHDRVHWEAPQWFLDIEKHLPIKNKTLTFSYLVASREKKDSLGHTRVVGDPRKEKGKTRWLTCSGPEKEFLSVLKKHGKPPAVERGDLLMIKESEKKSNERRCRPEDIEII